MLFQVGGLPIGPDRAAWRKPMAGTTGLTRNQGGRGSPEAPAISFLYLK